MPVASFSRLDARDDVLDALAEALDRVQGTASASSRAAKALTSS